jgi:putative transposase
LDAVSREVNVPAATLSSWREAFLAGAEANLKSHTPTPADDENIRLRALIGDMTMRNELLREKIRVMEKSSPLASRRSKL